MLLDIYYNSQQYIVLGPQHKDFYSRDSHDQESKKNPQPQLTSKPFIKQGGQLMASSGGKSSSSNSLQEICNDNNSIKFPI